MNKFDKFYNEHINEDIESDLYAHKDRYNKGLEPEETVKVPEDGLNRAVAFIKMLQDTIQGGGMVVTFNEADLEEMQNILVTLKALI